MTLITAVPVRKPRLSISAIDTLSKCGEQYKRRYIDGQRIPPGIALIVGSSVDDATNGDLTSKMNTGELLPVDAVADIARDGLNRRWEEGVLLSEEEKTVGEKTLRGESVDKSVRLSVLHANQVAPIIEPVAVQRECVIPLPEYSHDLIGYIDVQEKTIVRDTKTSGKTPNAEIAHQSSQLTMYGLMVERLDGVAPESFVLDYLIDTKVPKAVSFPTKRDEEDYKTLFRRIENALDVIKKGAFVPAREGDWWCSARFCGYHSTCPYVRHPKQIAV